MLSLRYFVVCASLFVHVIGDINSDGLGRQLIDSVEKMREIANTCLEKSPKTEEDAFGEMFQQCVKVKVFECVDRLLDAPKIEVGAGVEFAKCENMTSSGGVEDVEDVEAGRESKTASMSWPSLFTDRAEKVFHTHVVRVNFGKSRDLASEGGRGAKHSLKLLFPLMVVVFMKMAAFMVPLGFQFMAMIGGKALLLSKMALLMASVQGLKGVAHGWPSYGGHQQGHHVGSPHTDHHYASSGYGKSSQ